MFRSGLDNEAWQAYCSYVYGVSENNILIDSDMRNAAFST